MKKTTWLAACMAAMMAMLATGCDNGSSEPDEQEEPGLVYQDGWLLAGSTVRQYRGTETSVTTPAGVTRIGEHAFENCTGITAVTIGDGVTVIDDYAFYGCKNLATVTVPASVALIGSGAFYGCALDTVRYGGTIAQWCAVDGIGAVAGAEHVSVAGEDLTGRTSLAIPDGTKTIAARAFYYCEDLTDVTVPASVTRIGGEAFREYTALKALQFGGTKAQWQAIEGCDTVAVPCIQCSDGYLGVKDVPGYLKIYGTKVTGYTGELPENLVIPDGVTNIGEGAFRNCKDIASVEIPAGVTGIRSNAFYNCTSLAEVTIPASVKEIGEYAFSYCNKLTDVTYGGTLAQWCAVDDVSALMSYAEHVTVDGTDLKQAATLAVPDGATKIAKYAFYKCTNLASMTIPDSVTEIGIGAFSNCTKLKELQFNGTKAQWQAIEGSDTVAVPGIQCSDGYLGVKDAPDYLIMVGTVVTGYADGLPANLVIPDGVTGIRYSAFYNCTTLESVEIPGSVEGIGIDYSWVYGGGAFEGCTNLTSVKIGDGVKSIGKSSFYGCTSLASVTIPGSVTEIEDGDYYSGAFAKCTSLASVKIGDGMTKIGEYAFYQCENLASVEIGDGVTSIGKSAFYGCKSLESVTIPASVTSIGDYAFYQCTNLTSVKIGDGVKSIGKSSFYGCTSLASVTIPASVTEIGIGAFSWCDNLKEVTYGGTLAQWQAIEGSGGVNATCIQCSDGYLGVKDAPDYLTMSGTVVTGYTDEVPANLVIPDGVTSIGYGAFKGCTSLTTVTIPDGVTSIGTGAFENCTSLTTVTIPASVTEIVSYKWPATTSAFSGCTNLDTVTYQGTLAQWCALGGNGDLTYYAKHVTMSDGTDLKQAETLVIPDGVTGIGDYAFYKCESLASVAIPDSVTSIGSSAFSGCTSLASVAIPDSVTSIGSSAFSGCTSLASVAIPDSVTSIGSSAFSGCTNLTSVTIPDGVKSIGNYAFYGCTSLASVTIPGSVTSIRNYAFYGCTSLTSVTIPASVTSIGYEAFYGCANLTEVTYLGTKDDWRDIEKGSDIFSGTKKITGKDGTFTVDSDGNITE